MVTRAPVSHRTHNAIRRELWLYENSATVRLDAHEVLPKSRYFEIVLGDCLRFRSDSFCDRRPVVASSHQNFAFVRDFTTVDLLSRAHNIH